MTSSGESQRSDRIEAETRRKFSSGDVYKASTITVRRDREARDFFGRLNNYKLGLVERHAHGQRVLDVCTASGEHLFALSNALPGATGLDFSLPFLQHANEESRRAFDGRYRFVCGNARRLPFANGAFGVVFSFSSLYAVPNVGEALSEMRRVLAPDGVAAFDLGNVRSLNTAVARAHTETAEPCYIPVGEMRRSIREAGLEVAEHRAFQVLPMWGEKPRWMRPLLHPLWKRLMERDIFGRMLDERLCALPGLGRLAFRHVFLCRRSG